MKYEHRRKHKACQLITVWTKYTLSVTRLRQNTEITVKVFAVRKFSLELNILAFFFSSTLLGNWQVAQLSQRDRAAGWVSNG